MTSQLGAAPTSWWFASAMHVVFYPEHTSAISAFTCGCCYGHGPRATGPAPGPQAAKLHRRAYAVVAKGARPQPRCALIKPAHQACERRSLKGERRGLCVALVKPAAHADPRTHGGVALRLSVPSCRDRASIVIVAAARRRSPCLPANQPGLGNRDISRPSSCVHRIAAASANAPSGSLVP